MSFLGKVQIPATIKKDRFALLFVEWESPILDPSLDVASATKVVRVVAMTSTAEQAKSIAVSRYLEFYPGCAIIIDTKDGRVLRADYLNSGYLPLTWIDTRLEEEGEGVVHAAS